MAHGNGRKGKWRGNYWKEWVASTLHTTSEHGASNITTADAHTSAASSRLNWRPRRFKWTRLFRRKTKYGFCACVITFQLERLVGNDMIEIHSMWYVQCSENNHPAHRACTRLRLSSSVANLNLQLCLEESLQEVLLGGLGRGGGKFVILSGE